MNLADRISSLSRNGLEATLDSPLHAARPASRLTRILAADPEQAQQRRKTGSHTTSATTGVYAGLTVADLLYDVARVDPLVLQASDFSSTADLADPIRFGAFATRVAGLDEAARAGHLAHLEGYVAERLFAQSLQSQGFEVEFPARANQPGFDLFVGGIPHQVKNIESPAGVYEHLNRYPDIPVIVNSELAEEFEANPDVFAVPLSHTQVMQETRASLQSGTEIRDLEIPAIAVAVGLGRAALAVVRKQSDFGSAVPAALVDTAGMAAGGWLGSTALSFAGLALGPYGAVVGGILGSVLGARQGMVATRRLKRRIFCADEEAGVDRTYQDLMLRTAELTSTKRAEVERKGEIMESHLVHKGSVGTEVWKRFRVRLDDELRYYRNKAERTAGLALNFRSADKSAEPLACAEAALTEVMRCGLPEAALRQELQAANEASESLRLAYARALAS